MKIQSKKKTEIIETITSVFDVSVPKNAITELYKNFSYEILSGARNLEFSVISDLILEISFEIKRLTWLSRKRKEEEDEKTNAKIKVEHGFF